MQSTSIQNVPQLDAEQESRSQTICGLLNDIAEAKAKGQVNRYVCLFCERCQCFVLASTAAPEPVHHCNTVLEMATCGCCGAPATHWREMAVEPETNSVFLEAFADGHYYGWKRNREMVLEVLRTSALTGAL